MCFNNSRHALGSGVLIVPHSEDRQQWWLWRRPRRCSAGPRHQSAALAVSRHKSGFRFRSLCACHQTQLFALHRSLLSFRSIDRGRLDTETFSVTGRSGHGSLTVRSRSGKIRLACNSVRLYRHYYWDSEQNGRNVTVCGLHRTWLITNKFPTSTEYYQIAG